jgi:hypothetical protein
MLTPAQLQTLKADILADPVLAAIPNNSDGNTLIAAAYNAPASPDYWVWRSFVSDSELYEATSPDGTTWSWSIYIARSQGERDAWRQMVNMKGGIDAALVNERTGIADIFSGAPGLAQRTHLLAMGRRKATRGEKLFATGSGTTGSPSVMTVEEVFTYETVDMARAA